MLRDEADDATRESRAADVELRGAHTCVTKDSPKPDKRAEAGGSERRGGPMARMGGAAVQVAGLRAQINDDKKRERQKPLPPLLQNL